MNKVEAGLRVVGAGLTLWSATACERFVRSTQIQEAADRNKTQEPTHTFTFTPGPTDTSRPSRTPFPSRTAYPTSTRIPTFTPRPSFTPTETLTPTSTLIRTPTLTPTLTWETRNNYTIETALDGETVTLRQIAINRVLVIHPYPIKDLVFGALTNKDGRTEVLFENFDCEFTELRDKSLLGNKEEAGTFPPADAWDISNTKFDQVEVKKTSELPGDIEVFESKSFILNGQETVCPEVPVVKPATDFAKRLYEKSKEIAVEIIDKFSQRKITPAPAP